MAINAGAPGGSPRLIVGLCGESGAGKTTTTGLLEARGFEAFSVSGLLRDEAVAAYVNPTREQVQRHGAEAQERHGADIFARHLLADSGVTTSRQAVVDGFRNLAEVAAFREHFGSEFRLLGLNAGSGTRFARVQQRGRPGDPDDEAGFRAADARAAGEGPATASFQENAALLGAADACLLNEGALADLQRQLDAVLADWGALP